jgi:hypothetical protein
LLPRDYRERILKLGFKAGRKNKTEEDIRQEDARLRKSDQGEPEGPYAELNELALRELHKWVPELGIHKLRRRVGRFANYEGVAQWRASTQGRPLEERACNLKVSGLGIRDFGDGRGYSALDLVMAARGTDLFESFCWLDEKLRPISKEWEEGLDRLAEAADAPSIEPGVEDAESDGDGTAAKDTDGKDVDPDDALVGREWEDGDPIPAPLPMLVPYFIPLEPCLGYLWGQSQTYKTFLLNTVAVAIASGGKFAGQQVTAAGLVYQIELEGSRSQLRVQAAKQFAGIDIVTRIPIIHVQQTPPSLIGAGKKVNPAWQKWARAIVRKAKKAAERWNAPLRLITIDPQNHFAGFTDEQSSAEGNVVLQCADCDGEGCWLSGARRRPPGKRPYCRGARDIGQASKPVVHFRCRRERALATGSGCLCRTERRWLFRPPPS